MENTDIQGIGLDKPTQPPFPERPLGEQMDSKAEEGQESDSDIPLHEHMGISLELYKEWGEKGITAIRNGKPRQGA